MLLSESDYQSLKKSVKGWTAQKLLGYGIEWPPVKGWRKRLIRQYEGGHRRSVESVRERIPVTSSRERRNVKRFYVNGTLTKAQDMTDAQLDRERVAECERKATREWYKRMSGEVRWKDGERESFRIRFDGFSKEIDGLDRRIAAEEFAAMTQGGDHAGESQKPGK